jgi:hypothetical protein
MKPRLRSADLTQEDWLAWIHARHGFHEIPWLVLIDAYEAADRRDADLMYRSQVCRDAVFIPRQERLTGFPHLALVRWRLPGGWPLDITCCA